MNPQLVFYDNQEFDINSLFGFQFNFDQLKYLLMSLIKNSKHVTQKIADFEETIAEKEDRIQDLEKQINNQDIFLSSKYKNFNIMKDEPVNINSKESKESKTVRFIYI